MDLRVTLLGSVNNHESARIDSAYLLINALSHAGIVGNTDIDLYRVTGQDAWVVLSRSTPELAFSLDKRPPWRPVIRSKLRPSLIRRSRIPVWPQNQIWGSWVYFVARSLS